MCVRNMFTIFFLMIMLRMLFVSSYIHPFLCCLTSLAQCLKQEIIKYFWCKYVFNFAARMGVGSQLPVGKIPKPPKHSPSYLRRY